MALVVNIALTIKLKNPPAKDRRVQYVMHDMKKFEERFQGME